MYPRFKVLELHSLYESILRHSGSNPQKFIQAFESSLNFQKIMLKNDVIKKSLFEQKKMSFKTFIEVFKKMEDLMFIQNITDYLEIIFDSLSK